MGDLSSSEAAAALGVSRSTLLRWFREGRISHAERDHRGWRRFHQKDIDRIRRELGQDSESRGDPEERKRWQRMSSYLRRVPAFRALAQRVLDELASCARFQGHLAGERLFAPGDHTTGLKILVKGRVRIFRVSQDGREQTLAVVTPFSLLDEAALFRSESTHRSFATCVQSSTVLILPISRVKVLTQEHPQLALAFLREFSNRIEDLEDRLEGLVLLSLEQRVARTLLDWSREQSSLKLEVPVTTAAWATFVGAARESLSRALLRFERDELIRRSGRHLEILNPEGLEHL